MTEKAAYSLSFISCLIFPMVISSGDLRESMTNLPGLASFGYELVSALVAQV